MYEEANYQVREPVDVQQQLDGLPPATRAAIRQRLAELADLVSATPSVMEVRASAFPVEFNFRLEDLVVRYVVEVRRRLVIVKSVRAHLSDVG